MTAILDTALYVVLHPFMMMLYGLLFHFGRKITAAVTHGADRVPCITDYWKKHPWQSVLAITGAMIGYGLFAHFPDFASMAPEIQNSVRVTAVGVGYMADSVVDAVGDRARIKIGSP